MLLVSSNQMHTYTYVPTRPQCSRSFSKSKLQLNALSRGFRWFSGAHSSDFRSSVAPQRKVHELVNHDSAVRLFPSLHSSRSFIKKSYQLHQCTVLNNRPYVPRSQEHRKRLSSTWLCIPNPYETSADRLIRMYRAKGFILFILSLFRSSGPSIHLSVLKWPVCVRSADHPSGLIRRDSHNAVLIHHHAYGGACPHDCWMSAPETSETDEMLFSDVCVYSVCCENCSVRTVQCHTRGIIFGKAAFSPIWEILYNALWINNDRLQWCSKKNFEPFTGPGMLICSLSELLFLINFTQGGHMP